MLAFEIKKIGICLFVLLIAVFIVPEITGADQYSSSSYKVLDPVIDSGQQSSSSANFGLGQSVSQTAIGKSTSVSFQLWAGFQYFYKVNANVLTASAGNAEVNLSWTVPQTFLGVQVASYELGTGTTSGSYTFQNLGNVTSYTKTGLTNGTPYYFIIKALSAGGTFLVFSNQATATPTGPIAPPPPPPPPSPGGGGGSSVNQTGSVTISGSAYPGSSVTILRDSATVANLVADASGNFTYTMNNLNAGTYSFGIYALDADGNQSPTVGFEQTITANVSSTKSGVLLPPTLRQSHTAVKQGETITFSGYTAANSSVALNFSGAQVFGNAVISNDRGFYSFSLGTGNLKKGDYQVSATAAVNGKKTPNSNQVGFSIGDNTVAPLPPSGCRRSDLNCDSKVDLVDFSILLFFWEKSDFSRNPRVDIDKSGDIGLRDLSIMLYDWTG